MKYKTILIITLALISILNFGQEADMPQWMRLTLQGESLISQGKIREALDFFLRAETLQPASTRVLMNIALTRRTQSTRVRTEEEREELYGQYLTYLKKVLRLDPVHDDARFYMDMHLGIIHEQTPFEHEDSLEYFRAGTEALRSGAFKSAEELFRKGLEQEKHPDFYKSIGVIGLQAGDAVKAEAHFNDSLSLQPIQYDVYMMLGELYERKGELSDARDQYIKALASYPHYFKAMQKISIVTRKMDKQVRFLNLTDPIPADRRGLDPDNTIEVGGLSEELKRNMFELRCWLSYHKALRKEKASFEKNNPGEFFVHTAEAETAAVSALLKYYRDNTDQAGVTMKQFDLLSDLEKEGLLEGAVYFYRWRDDFAEEFVKYRKNNFREFCRMFEEHL